MATVIFKVHVSDNDLAYEIANDIYGTWTSWFLTGKTDKRIVAIHAEVAGT